MEVNEPLLKLTLSKYEWTWNSTYQNLYDKAKSTTNRKCDHSILQQLYPADRCAGSHFRGKPLQARDGMQFPRNEAPDYAAMWPIAFASKSLASMEIHCGNIE